MLMKVILITLPDFFEGEEVLVNEMFAGGLEILHLRKPTAGLAEMENFVLKIEERYRDRVVLHNHFSLIGKYGLRGAHLGVNRPLDIENFRGVISFSCHSLREVAEQKPRCSYVFLSPIFNSISKRGYNASLTTYEIMEARKSGLIDEKVIALGGVTHQRCDEVKCMGFGGVAILGDVWQSPNPVERLSEYLAPRP